MGVNQLAPSRRWQLVGSSTRTAEQIATHMDSKEGKSPTAKA